MSYYKHRCLIVLGQESELQELSETFKVLLDNDDNTSSKMLSGICKPAYHWTCSLMVGPNGSGYADDADDLYRQLCKICDDKDLQYCWISFGGDDYHQYFME